MAVEILRAQPITELPEPSNPLATTLAPNPQGDRVLIQSNTVPTLLTYFVAGQPIPAGYHIASGPDLTIAQAELLAGKGYFTSSRTVGRPEGFAVSPVPAATPPSRPARGLRDPRTLPTQAQLPLPKPEPPAPAAQPPPVYPPRPARVPREPRPPRQARATRSAPRSPRPPRAARTARAPRAARPARVPRVPGTKNARQKIACKGKSVLGGGCVSTECNMPANLLGPTVGHSSCNWGPMDEHCNCITPGCTGPAAGFLKALIGILPKGWFPAPPPKAVKPAVVKRPRGAGYFQKPIPGEPSGQLFVARGPLASGAIATSRCLGGSVICCGLTGIRCGPPGPACGHCTDREMQAAALYGMLG